MALMSPFAVHQVPSAASLVDDRDLRSGVLEMPMESLGPLWGNDEFFPWFVGDRLGEASHPGPFDLVVGCTNPSGLRGKETMAVSQGPGIWTYSESHLSAITQKTAARALKAAAQQDGRHVRVHFGAPAALRSNSTWAGTHTGVTCVSDYRSKALQIQWPPDLWASGRILATQHFISGQVLTLISLYGLPRGPTWPQARQQMNDILSFVSQTFIFGHQGHVIVAGDFNFGPQELDHFHLWRSMDWNTAQEHAIQNWGHAWVPTCKGATERDLIWLSPSLLSRFTKISINDVFSEHSSVRVHLTFPDKPQNDLVWPQPSQIPWDSVDWTGWETACSQQTFVDPDDSDELYAALASNFENSLTGHIDVPGKRLHPSQCGRANRKSPILRPITSVGVKPSRPGEIHLRHDLVGTAVLKWFRQLRRIQSYLHAIKANKMTAAAQQYRCELWSCILQAPGFQFGFRAWWEREGFVQLIGRLPLGPPNHEFAQWLYAAFLAAFRRFEAWHLHKKQLSTRVKFERNFQAIFRDLREPCPEQIDTLWDARSYEVIATRRDRCAVLVDKSITPLPTGRWFRNGCELQIQDHIEEMIVFVTWPNLQVGDTLIHQQHTRDDAEVHARLQALWQPRWNRHEAVNLEVLDRASSFVQAYVPRLHFDLDDITPDEWYSSVARLKPTAARGPDGFAKMDLMMMPLFYVKILLRFLTDIEMGKRQWPSQMLMGFVLALAKRPDSHHEDSYRPIVLFSMVYRLWASLRCRQMLSLLETWVHSDAHGFLPGREALASWASIQCAIELALQTGQTLNGLATDLKKAFNNIQRPQWFLLAEHLGLPARLLTPWKSFLGSFTRRFQVHGNLSSELGSNVGFAEGDPLSVMAMVLIDWCLHIYQHALAPPLRTLSFVDNISMLTREQSHLILGFFALKTFLDLWGLELDLTKSYAWCTTATARKTLALLGIQINSDAAELGGSLSLGAARRVRLILARGSKLAHKWQRLKVSRAPLAYKLACLPAAFWSAALHGCLGSVFADTHIHGLRKQAMKALNIRSGGMNSILRLSLADPTTADPGYYQLRTCLFDFRRLVDKCPDILHMWRCYMQHFDGTATSGPFFKLIDLFGQLGWRFTAVPGFVDHDECSHDFLSLSPSVLDRR